MKLIAKNQTVTFGTTKFTKSVNQVVNHIQFDNGITTTLGNALATLLNNQKISYSEKKKWGSNPEVIFSKLQKFEDFLTSEYNY